MLPRSLRKGLPAIFILEYRDGNFRRRFPGARQVRRLFEENRTRNVYAVGNEREKNFAQYAQRDIAT